MHGENRSQSVQELRKFPRVSASCSLSYRPVDADPAFQALSRRDDGIVNNISGGGISFVSKDKLEIGTMLALEVALPGFPTNVISMGRVVWSEKGEEGSWENGVEFWWIGWKDEVAQNQIRGFISDALRTQK